MGKQCKYCGAVLEDNAKICTNCGKVVASSQQMRPHSAQSGQFSGLNQGNIQTNKMQNRRIVTPPPQAQPQNVQKKQARKNDAFEDFYTKRKTPARSGGGNTQENFSQRAEAIRPYEKNSSSGKENRSTLAPLISRIIKILLVIVALWFVISAVRIVMVYNSTYDFGVDKSIKLEDNYGNAMSSYFESGMWHYNILGNDVYYKGKADGKTYELHFGKQDGQTAVVKLTVDGSEQKSDDLMKSEILGMFMTKKE